MVITNEYLEKKRKIRVTHRDVSKLESLKVDLSKLQGWMEQIREDAKDDNDYCGWEASEINDFIQTLGEVWTKLDKEQAVLYKKYGLEV